MIGQLICPRLAGEALSLPKPTQPSGSVNVERLRAAPTRCGGNRGLAGRQIGDPSVLDYREVHTFVTRAIVVFLTFGFHGRKMEKKEAVL